jgi:UDP-N-acetylmuramoyl-tripeptide--D-alanyl-D-alanine ligase
MHDMLQNQTEKKEKQNGKPKELKRGRTVKPLNLHEILPSINGVVIRKGPPPVLEKVITQKKKLQNGSLFFCLDRNLKETDFRKAFPPCVIISDRVEKLKNLKGDVTIVKVNNIKKAYQSFLQFYRSLFDIPVIAITGTSGKTTTKEMIRHILSARYKVKATLGNYNLFRSNASVLANFEEETEYAVFEFGIGKTGNLERCGRYFGPYSALITGIGADHIERFGTTDKYVVEKLKILTGVGKSGYSFLNADCPNTTRALNTLNTRNPVWFGLGDKADYKAEDIRFSTNKMEFTLRHKENSYHVTIPGYGIHNVYNSLAAIAVTHIHGFDILSAIDRLGSFRPLRRHLEVKKGLNGSTLIDDTWNTNSSSVQAALSVLKEISKGKHSIAVLGKISELGKEEKTEHKKIAGMIIKSQPSVLITIGETAATIGKEALQLGMNSENIHLCKQPQEAFELLKEIAGPHSVILVKASMRESFRKLLKNLKG